jgi:hypothetical protein
MWQWLAKNNRTPCSTKTAADIVTEMYGENYWTDRSTNYDTIRKRTADLMNMRSQTALRQIPDQVDPDGTRRDHYDTVVAP